MKFPYKGKVIAAVAAAGIAVAGAVVAPASAATRETLVYAINNPMTSLNSGKQTTNVVTNSLVGYLTGSGFWYYDNKKTITPNTVFGSYKISKNSPTDFQITATVKKGRVWSDGTPIDGVDLLLSHVLQSNAFSKAAGLGDPADESKPPVFDSNGYNSTYDEFVVGEPILSKDKMTVTTKFKAPLADFEFYLPGPAPVHTMVHLANGKTSLQSAAANLAAKAAFLKAFQTKDTGLLSKIGKVWTDAYDISTIDDSTNPLLLVGNGGFKIKNAVDKQSVTFVRNPKYNSGPAFKGNIKTLVMRFINDPTAAAQAMANGELDIFDGAVTADSIKQFQQSPNVTVVGKYGAVYEHVDLRVGAVDGDAEYTGPFAYSNNSAKNTKARDLRKAFLLAFPRDEIVTKLVQTINPTAQVSNSSFVLPDAKEYDDVVKQIGVNDYITGTQESRTKKALELVQKYYPTASATNPVIKLRGIANTTTRRVQQGQLSKAELAKAGFDITWDHKANAGDYYTVNDYDVALYAWRQTAVSQTGPKAIFETGGGNNSQGYSNPLVDQILSTLAGPQKRSDVIKKYIAAEKLVVADAVTLNIFQWPEAVPFNKALKNVKPSSLSPTLLWNFWELSY